MARSKAAKTEGPKVKVARTSPVNARARIHSVSTNKAGCRVVLHFNHGALDEKEQAFLNKFVGDEEEFMTMTIASEQPHLPTN